MTVVLAQKLFDLLPYKGNLLMRLIYCINDQNDFDRRVGLMSGSIEGMKGDNLRGQAVVQQRKVLEFEA